MSDRFLNNRKLVYVEFIDYESLTEFINNNEIESDDIQQIIKADSIILLYWD